MKKLIFAFPGVILLAWLGLWVSNTGILVFSAGGKIPATRDCTYFIGITVVKKIAPLAERCPLIRKV